MLAATTRQPATDGARGDRRFLLDDFQEPGLYLLLADGTRVTLTHHTIHEHTEHYLADPALLPPQVRRAVEYQPCKICPTRDAAICHALPTVFPLLEHVDRFVSHDPVVAAYRAEPGDAAAGMLHVVETTLQRALQHVSILSLLHYCEVGRAYGRYFAGVIPFMDAVTMAGRVYQNLYLELRGDEVAIEKLVAAMRSDLDYTVRCQIERLRLICRNDAFINAFVNMHIATQFLDPALRPALSVVTHAS